MEHTAEKHRGMTNRKTSYRADNNNIKQLDLWDVISVCQRMDGCSAAPYSAELNVWMHELTGGAMGGADG